MINGTAAVAVLVDSSRRKGVHLEIYSIPTTTILAILVSRKRNGNAAIPVGKPRAINGSACNCRHNPWLVFFLLVLWTPSIRWTKGLAHTSVLTSATLAGPNVGPWPATCTNGTTAFLYKRGTVHVTAMHWRVATKYFLQPKILNVHNQVNGRL